MHTQNPQMVVGRGARGTPKSTENQKTNPQYGGAGLRAPQPSCNLNAYQLTSIFLKQI